MSGNGERVHESLLSKVLGRPEYGHAVPGTFGGIPLKSREERLAVAAAVTSMDKAHQARSRRLSVRAAVLGISGVFLMLLDREVFRPLHDKSRVGPFMGLVTDVVQSALTVLLMIVLYQYYAVRLDQLKRRHMVPANASVWSNGITLWPWLVEETLAAVHVGPWALAGTSPGLHWASDLVGLAMFARFYLLIRVLRDQSPLMRQGARFIGSLTGVTFDSGFIIRAGLERSPVSFIGGFGLMGSLILSYIIFVAERHGNDDSAPSGLGEAFWLVLATITTTGYGDVVPTTFAGRATAVIAAAFGTALSALMIAVVAARLSLSPRQSRVVDFLKAGKAHTSTRHAAAGLIQAGWRLSVARSWAANRNDDPKVTAANHSLYMALSRWHETRAASAPARPALAPMIQNLSMDVCKLGAAIQRIEDSMGAQLSAISPAHTTTSLSKVSMSKRDSSSSLGSIMSGEASLPPRPPSSSSLQAPIPSIIPFSGFTSPTPASSPPLTHQGSVSGRASPLISLDHPLSPHVESGGQTGLDLGSNDEGMLTLESLSARLNAQEQSLETVLSNQAAILAALNKLSRT